MSDRLEIENLTKVFSASPERALHLLAQGWSKDCVLAEIGVVVGLNAVSMTVPAGAIYMIMGLSGSGKSTLARCINRLNEPTRGRILLDGQDLVTLGEAELRQVRRTRISMVFQHFALLPNKSVIENTAFGLKLRGVAPAQRRRRAEEVLAVVGLSSWAYHFPHELSGGMRQRVGLARALATDADVLIMDEAFSALDPLIRTEMQDELLRLQRAFQKTILFITHDFQEALKLGSRIAIMADGVVVREGTPQAIVLEPGSDYVAAFTREIDRSRLFDARSVMRALGPLSSDGIVVDADGTSFRLDPDRRIPAEAGEAAAYVTVPADAKLCEVAGRYRHGTPMAVLDDDGRVIGTIGPDQILSRIASPSPPSASSAGGHA
jgi:glycine betaine/proline transport system ATP-binding protein